MSDKQQALDAPYFKKNLQILVRDIEQYTPQELQNALIRLANAATPAGADKQENQIRHIQAKLNKIFEIANAQYNDEMEMGYALHDITLSC